MRFVIRGPDGGYFTEFQPIETKRVTLNGVFVGSETYVQPAFEAFKTRQAAHFATEADALAQIANDPKVNPLHGGPDAFVGCTVQSTED